MAESPLILGYWGLRARAQPIRYLLEYLGLNYQEKRYTSPEQWFGGDAAQEPIKSHVLQNLPYLKDGDKYIYESGALYVYAILKANRKELFGSTPEELIHVAQVRGVILDILDAFFRIIYDKDNYAAQGKERFTQNVVPFLQTLNDYLQGKKFAAGDNITVADFQLFEVADTLRVYDNEVFKSFPNIVRIHNTFADLPAIKAYLASDRFIAVPFYPPHLAAWTGL